MTAAIRFENVGKRYRLGGQDSLRETLAQAGGRLARRGGEDARLLWALRDVNLEVQPGEALGVVGSNGAGKTTMLKLLSRVTRPTTGVIRTDGRIAALIELGAGFHPDLTGRENVYLYGAILGLSQSEVRRRFDQIVAFAELEQFIDTPVKRYSSGMYARLGFAVAAHVDPDVFLVDEVLSVGDEAFQAKCRDFIHSFVKSGRTSVFVSHNLYAIDQLCDRIIWLEKGKIMQSGPAGEVLRAYMDETDRRIAGSARGEGGLDGDRIRIRNLVVTDEIGSPRSDFRPGESIGVAIDYESGGVLGRPYFCVWVSEAESSVPLIAANMLLDDFVVPDVDGRANLTLCFRNAPLMPRAYSIWVEVYGQDRAQLLYKWRVLGGFRIVDDSASVCGAARGSLRFRRAHGAVRVPYEWGYGARPV